MSYAPGSSAETAPVHTDNRIVQTPAGLADALQFFEHERVTLRAWADAVCINAADVAEKDYAVGMAAEIFGRAEA